MTFKQVRLLQHNNKLINLVKYMKATVLMEGTVILVDAKGKDQRGI
jgi:hypothetical protein